MNEFRAPTERLILLQGWASPLPLFGYPPGCNKTNENVQMVRRLNDVYNLVTCRKSSNMHFHPLEQIQMLPRQFWLFAQSHVPNAHGLVACSLRLLGLFCQETVRNLEAGMFFLWDHVLDPSFQFIQSSGRNATGPVQDFTWHTKQARGREPTTCITRNGQLKLLWLRTALDMSLNCL